MTKGFERPFGACHCSGFQQHCATRHTLDSRVGIFRANRRDIHAGGHRLSSKRDVSDSVGANVRAAIGTHQLRIASRAAKIKDLLLEAAG
jgi:hypothetical protein